MHWLLCACLTWCRSRPGAGDSSRANRNSRADAARGLSSTRRSRSSPCGESKNQEARDEHRVHLGFRHREGDGLCAAELDGTGSISRRLGLEAPAAFFLADDLLPCAKKKPRRSGVLFLVFLRELRVLRVPLAQPESEPRKPETQERDRRRLGDEARAEHKVEVRTHSWGVEAAPSVGIRVIGEDAAGHEVARARCTGEVEGVHAARGHVYPKGQHVELHDRKPGTIPVATHGPCQRAEDGTPEAVTRPDFHSHVVGAAHDVPVRVKVDLAERARKTGREGLSDGQQGQALASIKQELRLIDYRVRVLNGCSSERDRRKELPEFHFDPPEE